MKVGALCLLVPLNLFLCVLMFPEGYTEYDSMKYWKDLDFTFRLFAFVTLIVLGAASNMQILKKHEINYQYIFEVEPNNEVSYIEVYNAGLLMAVVFNVCFMLQVMVFKFFWEFKSQTKVPTMMLCLIFLAGLMFNPFKWLHRPARFEICKTLGKIFIAPF